MDNLRKSNTHLQLLAYIFLAMAATYFVGLRGEDIGSDTPFYLKYFDFVKYGDSLEGVERVEIGFYWLTKIISYFTDSKCVYLSIIFLIQFIGITSALFKKNEIFRPYLFLTFIWLSYPFFYSITLNTLRQGLAFVFVIYAIDAKLQNKKYSPYILLLLGSSLHYSILSFIICFIILELKPKFITLLWFWFFVVGLVFFGWMELITNQLLELIVLNKPYYSSYLDSSINEDYVTGFRLDFTIFSALPIAYYFLNNTFNRKNRYRTEPIFIIYLIMNIFYFCFAHLPYSDRFGLASWILIPLMIDIDFLQNNRILRPFKLVIVCSSIIFLYYYFFLPK